MKEQEKLTICIPCFNNLSTIKTTLNALNYQEIYPKIIIYDNGSKDGTFEALIGMLNYKWFPDLNIELKYEEQMSGRKEREIPFIRYKLSQAAESKYILFLDADILISPYSIIPLINEFEKNHQLGMMSIKSSPYDNHCKMGCAMIRAELAKKIKWKIDDDCECVNAAKEIKEWGYKVMHHPIFMARHIQAQ